MGEIMSKIVLHHDILNINLTSELNSETFNRRGENDTIECVDEKSVHRKFLKSYVKLLSEESPKPKKKKRKEGQKVVVKDMELNEGGGIEEENKSEP